MSGLKKYFAAGLAVEEAREAQDEASRKLRLAALEHCPAELRAYDDAKAITEAAMKNFADTVDSVEQEQRAMAHQMLHARGINCGDEKCPLRKGEVSSGDRLN